jgi:hypothetical protein
MLLTNVMLFVRISMYPAFDAVVPHEWSWASEYTAAVALTRVRAIEEIGH